ncbi:beta-lactamase family protein [Streptomyces sp. ISL-90]|nr:beta-lactamase family protein [Streptomyces sp. ISL-90]
MATTELPASAMEPLDEAAASELRGAAEEGFELTAAPGAIVAVRSPEGTWIESFGVADPDTGAPMEPDLYVRVGSVTKTFMGSLVLQLDEQGELSLDDTIDQYVDGVPNGDEVTIRMLLDMTSGVASYTRDEAWLDIYLTEPATVWTPDQLLEAGLGLPPNFEPGERFEYSNTNTVLLGKVVEEVTGLSFTEVLEQQILEPLQLNHTSFPADAEIPDPHPRGFSLQGTPDDSFVPVDATYWSPTFGWTAGQMISNVDDLLVWGRALGTGQGILDAEESVVRLTSFPGELGYGLAMGCVDGWVGHSGELPGFNTSVFYDTTSDTTVITIANSDVATGDCTVSKTLPDDPKEIDCMAPATRIFVALSEALGHPFSPPLLS